MSKFKVGDKVYRLFGNGAVETVISADSIAYPLLVGGVTYRSDGVSFGKSDRATIFHATKENHAVLSTLFPEIKFELPLPTNNEIVQNMLKDGKPVMCYLSDDSYDMAVFKGIYGLVASYDADEGFDAGGSFWKYVVPMTYSDVMDKIGFVQENVNEIPN